MAVSEWSRAIAIAAFVTSYVGLALGRVPGFRIARAARVEIGSIEYCKVGVPVTLVTLLLGWLLLAWY